MSNIKLQSVITCPNCGHAKEETMPMDACVWRYVCEHCRTIVGPKAGDCCVFCSYGTERCPPMQQRICHACPNRHPSRFPSLVGGGNPLGTKLEVSL